MTLMPKRSQYTPPRPLEEIDAELKQAEEEILRLLREVTA
jgi:type I restriction enzyme M protein